jgi:hypothetical protein
VILYRAGIRIEELRRTAVTIMSEQPALRLADASEAALPSLRKLGEELARWEPERDLR